MEIVPLVGQTPVTVSTISVQVNPDDRARAKAAVVRTSAILAVNDQEAFLSAKRAAGQLKALIDEIADSRKAANRPFRSVEKAINDLATEVGQPVADEHNRILGLLNDYVARLEAAAKEEERKKTQAVQRQIAEQQAKLNEANAAKRRAEEEARAAQDELAKARAREALRQTALAAEQAQLATEMAAEIAHIGEQPKRALVSGGRVDHKWTFHLVDVRETIKGGGWRLLRFELDRLACQDSCKAQMEINPDKDPTLPGIEVTRSVNVSVRASAKIE